MTEFGIEKKNKMMLVVLHGILGREFGREWHLDVSSPAEAVRAIQANKPGFCKRIIELDRRGLVFRVRLGGEAIGEEELHLRSEKRLDITPVVQGAGAAARFVAGVALVVLGYFTFGATTALGMALISGGVGMMLGAVVEWLTPIPKRQEYENPENKPSYYFNGGANTTTQGLPVPVGYGELLVGSHVVSVGIYAEDMGTAAQNGSVLYRIVNGVFQVIAGVVNK